MLLRLPAKPIRPLRVGFVTPVIFNGGAERWIVQIAQRASRLRPTGFAVLSDHLVSPELLARAQAVAPVHSAGGTGQTQAEVVQAVAAESDILLAWGRGDVAELCGPIEVPVVYVSHGSADLEQTVKLCGQAADGGAHFLAAVAECARAAFPAKVRPLVSVIENGIELDRLYPKGERAELRASWGYGERDRVILYVGRLAREKRVELLVAALARLPENFKLLIVGSDVGAKPSIEQAARFLAPGRVGFAQPAEFLGDVLAVGDVFCLPSRTEAQSLALLEAMAVGLPCVACAIDSHRELAQRNGDILWLTPADPTAAELAAQLAAAATRSVSEGNDSEPEASARDLPAEPERLDRVARARQIVHTRYHLMRSVGRWEQYLFACHREWTDHALYPPLNLVGPG